MRAARTSWVPACAASSSDRSRSPRSNESSASGSASRFRARRSCASPTHRAATRFSRSRSRACSPAVTCRRPRGVCRCPTISDHLPQTGSRRFRRRHANSLLRAAALAHPNSAAVDIRALAPAEEAGLISIGADGVITFTHPLFASAVYESASATARADVHRALADVVDDPEQRARHLALASTAPDAATARALKSAARAARARGAPDTAAELVELALQLTPTGSTSLDEPATRACRPPLPRR